MTESKNIPELRFPGFRGAWEEKKLGEIVERVTRRNEESLVNHVLTISGEHGLIDQEEYFNKRVASKNLSNYYLIYRDEFAYNKSYSNGYPYGAIKRLKRYDEGVLSSLYICFKSHQHSDILYLENYFESDNWHKEIYKIAVEGARNHGLLNISIGDFFSSKHFIPPLPEQEKIGSFFYTLDQKLDLQKKRIEELKTYKKGMMQRIFDQEIRFKDENGQDYPEWEEKKLGELGEFLTSSVNKKIKKNEEIVKLYNYMDVYNKISMNNKNLDNLSITSATKTQIENNNLLKGDILITPSSETPEDIGHSVVIRENLQNTLYSYHLIRFRPNITMDILFSNYWFNNENVRKEFIIRSQGATRFTLSINNIKKVKVKYPCNSEQEKIGLFLSAIDKKIELEEERLESYEEFKKGLMQRMFV